MSEEKKTAATEDVKETRKLSMEELEQVTGGDKELEKVTGMVAALEKHGLEKLGDAVVVPGGGASQLLN